MPHKIIILGGGESGVGAAMLAKRVGDSAFVSDAGSIATQYREKLNQAGIAFEEGGHQIESFFDADVIVKSPGIPSDAPLLEELRARGLPIISEIEYGFRHCQAKIIAVTGSNGKTTTSSLIHHLLVACGVDAQLGGNIGKSFAEQVAADKQPVWYVLEVSSFQLDDVDRFQPDVALLLNITPDHLDRYGGSMDAYAAAKMRIAENQTPEQLLIYMREDPETHKAMKNLKGNPRQLSFGLDHATGTHGWKQGPDLMVEGGNTQLTVDTESLQLLGPHNHLNVLAAILAVRCVGPFEQGIYQGLKSFQPIEHRLEPVASIAGIRYLNDSKATNVDAAKYALEAVSGSVIWLAGGVDKGNDYSPLMELVADKVRAVVFLGEYRLDHFRQTFDRVPIHPTASMEEALNVAQALAEPGDTVLLSPACASFDLFRNYEERGRQFKAAVARLSETTD